MTENLTDKLVKFAYGAKSNYSSASHSDYVYFATDAPLIHAHGMWRGVSAVGLSGNNLQITVGSKDDADNPAIVLSVSLSDIATTATQRKNWDTAYNFVESITGTDTDGVINKWDEIVEFLKGIGNDTLNDLMAKKADKTTNVFGGDGITVEEVDSTGSNPTTNKPTLGSPFRIKISNQMTAGTYTKLTVDDLGLVSAGTTLAASDIPTLAISKISGLQSALDGKMSNSVVLDVESPLSITDSGKLSQSPTMSLNYDNATLVLDSSTSKLKVGTIAQSQVNGLSTTLAGYVPTSRTITAGNGLTGGGNLTANRTLSVLAADASINVSSSGIKVVSTPKLTTARTLWGKSFDGTNDVSGKITVSGDIQYMIDDTTRFGSSGMRLFSDEGFIGFSHIIGMTDTDGTSNGFTGISLGWGTNPEDDDKSVRINADTFTYKGNPIYYKGLAQFTTDVNSLISTALAPIAADFTALTDRVEVVEAQLKWIEVTN